MSGLFDFLDELGTHAGNVAGKAVDAVSQVAIARVNAESAARVADQQTPATAATLSGNLNLGSSTLLWVLGGAVLIGAVILLARR